MEEKGYIKHKRIGVKYIYSTTESKKMAAKTAVKNVVQTFFDGSAQDAVVALLDASDVKLSKADLQRIEKTLAK